MNRLQQILIVILVVQIALVGWLFWPRSAEVVSSGPLFGELSAEDIHSFSVEEDTGESIELTREGGGWVVSSADNYPADSEKVDPILEKIFAIETGRLVTRTEDSHKRLQVADDDFLRRVYLMLADGKRYTLYIGSAPGASATHVRRGGQDQVFLTGELSSWEVSSSASDWMDTAYLSIPSVDVVAMTLENGQGTFIFERGGEGIWQMEGIADEEFNPNKVDSLLTRLSNLSFAAPLGLQEQPSYGMNSPNATVVLELVDESGSSSEVSLWIGAEADEDVGYTVRSSESEYYVRVSSFSVQDFVNFTREDFAATPAPVQ